MTARCAEKKAARSTGLHSTITCVCREADLVSNSGETSGTKGSIARREDGMGTSSAPAPGRDLQLGWTEVAGSVHRGARPRRRREAPRNSSARCVLVHLVTREAIHWRTSTAETVERKRLRQAMASGCDPQ